MVWMTAMAMASSVGAQPAPPRVEVTMAAATPKALETLAAAGEWHGTAVYEGGEYTEVRAAYDALCAEPTATLVTLLEHPAVGVRFAAVRALFERKALDRVPASLDADRTAITVCPGGCMCQVTSLAELLPSWRAGREIPWW